MSKFINRDNPRIRPTKYVTAYAVTRHMGGSEEGGWWYDAYHGLETVRVRRCRNVRRVERMLEVKHLGVAEGDMSSVLGGTEVVVMQERTPRQWATRGAPRYE